jgi:isopenicillin N synthase-like dioxygenase
MTTEVLASQNAPGLTNEIQGDGDSLPDDIQTAPLLTLKFNKLTARDPEETSRLLAASLDTGFFYLDLRKSNDGEAILGIADRIFDLAKEVFNIPTEEKVQAEAGRGVVATRFAACGSHIRPSRKIDRLAQIYDSRPDRTPQRQ